MEHMNNENMMRKNMIKIGYHGVPVITQLFVNEYMEQCLKNIFVIKELIDGISCVRLMHMRNRSHHQLMILVSVVVMSHHQIQQHKH